MRTKQVENRSKSSSLAGASPSFSSSDLSNESISPHNSKQKAGGLRKLAAGLLLCSPLAFANEEVQAQETVTSPVPVVAQLNPSKKTDAFKIETVELQEDLTNYANPYGGELLDKIIKLTERGPVKPRNGGFYSPATTGHETLHRLQSQICREIGTQDQYKNEYKFTDNRGYPSSINAIDAVYMGGNKLALIKDPNGVTLDEVSRLVPRSLRGDRYELYLRKSETFPDSREPLYRATYILNELSCYAWDAKIALRHHDSYYLEEYADGKIGETTGCMEFVAYGLALAQAIERSDDAYENEADKRQILAIIKYLVEESVKTYKESMNAELYPVFQIEHENMLEKLKTERDAAGLREAVKRLYGDQWASDVLGI